MVDEREGEDAEAGGASRVSVFCHEGGIQEYVEHICEAKTPLIPETLAITATKKGVTVDVALRWNADMYSDTMLGFANGVHTPDGGTHMEGVKAELTREGLVAVVSVRLPEAEFEGQTKNRLENR